MWLSPEQMFTCPLETFRTHYLPFKPTDKTVKDGKYLLTASGLLIKRDATEATSQRLEDDDENKVWGPQAAVAGDLFELESLANISRCLEDVNIEGRSANYRLEHRPKNAPQPSIWSSVDSETEPVMDMHGCFYPQSELVDGVPLAVGNIGSLNQYKGKKNNRRHVVSGANFAMNESPERMFVFGLTIAGDMVSVWYFSRSHSARSQSFNWKKDIDALVSILLSFIFASRSELGFDPTVTRCQPPAGGPEYFLYKILDSRSQETHFFKTLRSIYAYRLDISGPATRVWLCVEVKSGQDHTAVDGREMVLKEAWVSENARAEREIQDDIFRDVDTFIEKLNTGIEVPELFNFEESIRDELRALLTNSLYKRHFLTIAHDGNGGTSKTVADATRLGRVSIFRRFPSDSDSSLDSIGGPSTPTLTLSHFARRFASRRQYRVVYEEVCQAMQELKSFPESMKALRDGVIALIILYFAGWIHRDISGGNILWFTDENGNKRGILGDLEYSKKPSKESPPSADPMTGTPFFMAYEIMSLTPLYLPPLERNWSETQTTKMPLPDVSHNFLHDAESIWWLHLWTMTARVRHSSSQSLAHDIFVNQLVSSPSRTRMFWGRTNLVNHLHPKLLGLSETSGSARSTLVDAHRTAPDGRPLLVYSTVYTDLLDLCSNSALVDIQDLKPYPASRLAPSPLHGSAEQDRVDDDAEYTPSDEGVDLDDRPLKKRKH